MIRIPGRIPVAIYPTFWIFAALIGYVNSLTLGGTLIWVGIIFFSVLIHEYGHALTAALFGREPRIELVAFGGLTYHDGDQLPIWKQFLIVFNGPLFGFFLYLGAAAVMQFVPLTNPYLHTTVDTFRWVNLFWTLLNLLPVMPLDGGQLLRIVLEGVWGVRGVKYALFASMVLGAIISLFFFLYQSFLIGALFFLLAFQSYDTWRKGRLLKEQDRSEPLKQELEEAELLLHEGKKEEATRLFERIRDESKEGMIFILATQYLSYLKYEQGDSAIAYKLLLSIREKLSSDAVLLLHKAAFDEKDYLLAAELGGECFQMWPSVETALRNAYASAALAQVEPAVGWLETAIKEGLENLSEILQDTTFDKIRQEPAFVEFISSNL